MGNAPTNPPGLLLSKKKKLAWASHEDARAKLSGDDLEMLVPLPNISHNHSSGVYHYVKENINQVRLAI